MTLALLRVVDFETTGTPPDAAICQIGWTDVSVDSGTITVNRSTSTLANPGRPIPPDARGVHHISDADVAGAPSPDVGLLRLMGGRDLDRPHYFVAHNAVFEREFFKGGDVPWICTRKVGMRLWPKSPDFKNQTLRYFLGVDDDHDFDRGEAMPPHAAGPDTYVTGHIVKRALYAATLADMVRWTNEPSLLPGAIHFGKHKGTPWEKVDRGYLDWIVRQQNMDADVKYTARHWLAAAHRSEPEWPR